MSKTKILFGALVAIFALQNSVIAANQKSPIELVYKRNWGGSIGVYISGDQAKLIGGFGAWAMIVPAADQVVLFSKDNGTYSKSNLNKMVTNLDRAAKTSGIFGAISDYAWTPWKRNGFGQVMGVNTTKWIRTASVKDNAYKIKSAVEETETTDNYKVGNDFRSLLCAMLRTSPPSGLPVKFSIALTLNNGSIHKEVASEVVKIRDVKVTKNDFVPPPGLKKVDDFWSVVANVDDAEVMYQVRNPISKPSPSSQAQKDIRK